jgi:hypothetical protein
MQTKQKVLITTLIVLGVLLVVFFGLRAFRPFRELRGHRPPPPGEIETDVTLIRDWMTVPYIAQRYYVPGDKLFEAVNILPQGNKDKSLLQLNKEYYPDRTGFVLETIKADILAHQPPTPPAPPPTAKP